MGLSFPPRRAPTIHQWLALLLAAFIVPTTIAVVAPFLHSYGRERVAAEQRLARSEQRFRSAFDNAPLGLALVDRDNLYMRVNRAKCRLLGAPADELVGTRQERLPHLATLRR